MFPRYLTLGVASVTMVSMLCSSALLLQTCSVSSVELLGTGGAFTPRGTQLAKMVYEIQNLQHFMKDFKDFVEDFNAHIWRFARARELL